MSNRMIARTGRLVVATAVALSAACAGSNAARSDSAASTSTGSAAGATPQSTAASVPAEVTNATNFHVLDFVAWNNHDVDVFRRLHTADVKVNFGGNQTEGIDAHVQALEPMWQPGGVITNHNPIIAEGEWTCMVGVLGPNIKMVTVAKWRDGAISEEYILSNMLKPGAAKPAVSGSPVASISNQNAELKRLVGAEPGWSCNLERTAEEKMVIAIGKAGGTAAEQMVFTQ
ncbi:MAG TPA: nuclear transport factor 2 family protein [Gemmatimonadales bacterium]|nr:nuclear transport factor 2 family protein [Gemmatimonadales bacterium]